MTKKFGTSFGRIFSVIGLILAVLSPFVLIGIVSWLLLFAGLVFGIIGLVKKDKIFGLITVIVAAIILVLAIIGLVVAPVA